MLEHCGQAPHWLSSQLIGHSLMLQARSSRPGGHVLPLCWFSRVMVRVRFWVPPPQSTEQADQADHSVIWQSILHGESLQRRFCESTGQPLPLLLFLVSTWRRCHW